MNAGAHRVVRAPPPRPWLGPGRQHRLPAGRSRWQPDSPAGAVVSAGDDSDTLDRVDGVTIATLVLSSVGVVLLIAILVLVALRTVAASGTSGHGHGHRR